MEEQSLFQVRFTDEGKKYIRKFASISYFILGFIVLEAGFNIYWNIKNLLSLPAVGANIYFKLLSYVLIVSSVMSVVSNIYYVRFPHILLRSIRDNNEPAANNAFKVLLKGAYVFLVWMIFTAAITIWTITQNIY